ncbi:unnamed protein product [Oppiella nova]|uniref:Uncharacterized protein n=1 Tax=Oppiella nova TaxID=334625 RepID=A0A7R9QWQ3_9ACAR|nr:unnamed protein product [Oppiella nova]CAG2178414.1 unnamed protein product [Oppiella nova]
MLVAVQGLSIRGSVSPILTGADDITDTVGDFGNEDLGDASGTFVDVDDQGKDALTDGFNEGAQGIKVKVKVKVWVP